MTELRDEAQKARDLLASAEHVAILLPSYPAIDAIAAAEAISRVLMGQNKYVGFLPGVSPDARPVPDAFSHVKNPRPLIRERIVSIDTAAAPVGQLRYEKHDDRIEIILSPKSVAIREDAFSFREGKTQCDALIAIGVADIEALSVESLGLAPQFFTETPIINIGNGEGHKPYGEANLLSRGLASLSELTAACMTALDSRALDAETATILLTGVISDSHNFAVPVQIGSHLAAAQFLQAGADQTAALSLAADKHFTLLQLIARASVRSKETDGGRVLWSFLTADDFEKTGRTAKDAAAVIEALPHFFPPHAAVALLWQDPGTRDVRAMIHADSASLVSIADRAAGELRNPGFLAEERFSNFIEAEERIAALLSATG